MTGTQMLLLRFRHRQNLDGSWDSICLRCYVTAANAASEAQVALAERTHFCDEASWSFKEFEPPLPAPRPSGLPAFGSAWGLVAQVPAQRKQELPGPPTKRSA